MTLYMVIISTDIKYCSAVSRNYGGKTKEIIIISDLDRKLNPSYQEDMIMHLILEQLDNDNELPVCIGIFLAKACSFCNRCVNQSCSHNLQLLNKYILFNLIVLLSHFTPPKIIF